MATGGLRQESCAHHCPHGRRHPSRLVDILFEYFIDRIFAEVVRQDAFLGPKAVNLVR